MGSRNIVWFLLAVVALVIVFVSLPVIAVPASLPCELYSITGTRTFDGTNTKFEYTFEVCDGTSVKDISHSGILVGECIFENLLVDYTEELIFGLDPSVSDILPHLNAIKLDEGLGVIEGECTHYGFYIVLPGNWPGEEGTGYIKAGTGFCSEIVVVPSCDADPCDCENDDAYPVWDQEQGELDQIGSCGENPEFELPTATDQCENEVYVELVSDEILPGDCPGTWIRTLMYRTYDECGNENPVYFVVTIIIIDDESPIFTCPPDITVGSAVDADPDNTGYPEGTDNCGGDITFTYEDEIVSQTDCITVIERTWTGTDCSGNSDICIQTITVDECEPPETVIEGVKFFDYNEDGIMNGDDYPEEGVIFELYASSGCSGDPLDTKLTGSDGSVQFLVDPGTYWLKVIPPTGHYITNGDACRMGVVEEGQIVTIYYGNHEEAPCPGSFLEIEKEWAPGTEHPEGVDDLEFFVQGGPGQYFMPVAGGSSNVISIPVEPGTYPVSEIMDLLDGYDVTSSSSNGDQGSNNITVTVGECQTVRVKFTNSKCDDEGGCNCGGGRTGGCGGHLYSILASNPIPRVCLDYPIHVTAPGYLTGHGTVISYRWFFPEQPWSTPENPVYAIPSDSHAFDTLDPSDGRSQTVSFIPDVPSQDRSAFQKNYVLVCLVTFVDGTSTTLGYEFYATEEVCDYANDPSLCDPSSYKIVVFPNPSDNQFTFEVRDCNESEVYVETFSISVYNLAGRLIWNLNSDESIEWHLHDNQGQTMANGAYIYMAVAVVDGFTVSGSGKIMISR